MDYVPSTIASRDGARLLLSLLTAAAAVRIERHVVEVAETCHFIRGSQTLSPATSLLLLLKV